MKIKRRKVMNRNKFASPSKPLLFHSQLKFRIGLARKRLSSYPLDKMDFIMMDLERTDLCTRHAHWCTGDLTGRVLEFLSCAGGIDGEGDPRLHELFERIMRMRRPSGLFGRYAATAENVSPESKLNSGADRLFNGLTGDKHHLEFCGLIAGEIKTIMYAHASPFMATLRGLQIAALYTGDSSWNEKPEFYRQKIINEHYEMPDGCVGEVFPRGFRNEGPGAELRVENASVNVPVKFDNGKEIALRFWPLCYITSNMTYYDTPVIFKG